MPLNFRDLIRLMLDAPNRSYDVLERLLNHYAVMTDEKRACFLLQVKKISKSLFLTNFCFISQVSNYIKEGAELDVALRKRNPHRYRTVVQTINDSVPNDRYLNWQGQIHPKLLAKAHFMFHNSDTGVKKPTTNLTSVFVCARDTWAHFNKLPQATRQFLGRPPWEIFDTWFWILPTAIRNLYAALVGVEAYRAYFHPHFSPNYSF
jgi:hypothetical protein